MIHDRTIPQTSHFLTCARMTGFRQPLPAVARRASGGDQGWRDGTWDLAQFNMPAGIALSPDGQIYVADTGNHCIRVMRPDGQVRTVAGQPGVPGFRNGPGAAALFEGPTALVIDSRGLLTVLDRGNDSLRQITPDGVVRTAYSADPELLGGGLADALAIGPDDTVYAMRAPPCRVAGRPLIVLAPSGQASREAVKPRPALPGFNFDSDTLCWFDELLHISFSDEDDERVVVSRDQMGESVRNRDMEAPLQTRTNRAPICRGADQALYFEMRPTADMSGAWKRIMRGHPIHGWTPLEVAAEPSQSSRLPWPPNVSRGIAADQTSRIYLSVDHQIYFCRPPGP